MAFGSTSIAPFPRKCTVSRTLPSSASRRSAASSSSPVASGTATHRVRRRVPGALHPRHADCRLGALGQLGAALRPGLDRDELFGAHRAVALAPARVGAADDLLAE